MGRKVYILFYGPFFSSAKSGRFTSYISSNSAAAAFGHPLYSAPARPYQEASQSEAFPSKSNVCILLKYPFQASDFSAFSVHKRPGFIIRMKKITVCVIIG